ncbi:uncharacterized protein LOC143030581 isoform X2 [Oratosquilla oratoria]
MSKILPPPAAASLLTLVFVLVLQITGLFCFAEGQCGRMEYVQNGRLSSSVPFDSGLELEFVLLGLSGKKHFTYFYIQDDKNNHITVSVREKANILEEVKMWFPKTGWRSANEREEKKTLKFGTTRRAHIHLSEDVINVTLWNASDDGSHKTWSHSNPPIKTQRDLTIKARVPAGSGIHCLFHWLSCPPPHTCTRPPSTPPTCPSTSTEPQDAEPSPTFGACTSSPYFYLVVAGLVVIFLIPLVLMYIQLRRNIGSQKARDESNEVQNNENQEYYEELDLTQIPVAPPLHQRQRGVPGEENSESRDSINSIYNYSPNK